MNLSPIVLCVALLVFGLVAQGNAVPKHRLGHGSIGTVETITTAPRNPETNPVIEGPRPEGHCNNYFEIVMEENWGTKECGCQQCPCGTQVTGVTSTPTPGTTTVVA